jgi:hypothetical protein
MERDKINSLSKKVAEIYAQAVIQKLKISSCPKEQKLRLLSEIKSVLKRKE